MMMRSAPPRSMNLALMPVPAPAAMMAPPFLTVARRRSTTSLRVYGFPFPVQGFGISQRWFNGSRKCGGDIEQRARQRQWQKALGKQFQIPKLKSQNPNSNVAASGRSGLPFGVWNWGFGASLGFGIWSLEFVPLP